MLFIRARHDRHQRPSPIMRRSAGRDPAGPAPRAHPGQSDGAAGPDNPGHTLDIFSLPSATSVPTGNANALTGGVALGQATIYPGANLHSLLGFLGLQGLRLSAGPIRHLVALSHPVPHTGVALLST
jgi:hypothetical protein